jgi:hypothetical protein
VLSRIGLCAQARADAVLARARDEAVRAALLAKGIPKPPS